MSAVGPDRWHEVDVAAELEAIRRLKARYFRLLDTGAWDELVEVFTDPVHIDVSEDGGGTSRSPREFVDAVRRALDGAVTVHHGHMPELELTSPTTATGIWAMEDRIWFPEGSPVSRLAGHGHYHERYERDADGWRIASMVLTRLHRHVEP
jgi:hypothetical protein